MRESDGFHCDFEVAPPCAGAAVGRSSGGWRLLTRTGAQQQRNSVRSIEDSSLSSLQFESLFVPHTRFFFSLHPPLLGRAHGVDVTKSCGVMHDARMNSFGTSLHSACTNSGVHVNSYSCAFTNSSVEFGVEQSHEYEYSAVEIVPGCADTGVLPSSSSFPRFRVTWTG